MDRELKQLLHVFLCWFMCTVSFFLIGYAVSDALPDSCAMALLGSVVGVLVSAAMQDAI